MSKANAITVNKKEYDDMCKALVTETKECERLKELNRKMVELIRFFEMDIDNILIDKNYLIDWESRKTKIQNVLAKAEGEEK